MDSSNSILVGCPEDRREEILSNWGKTFEDLSASLPAWEQTNPGDSLMPVGWGNVEDLIQWKAGLAHLYNNGDVAATDPEKKIPDMWNDVIAVFEYIPGEPEETITVYNDLSVSMPRGKGDRVFASIHDAYEFFGPARSSSKDEMHNISEFLEWYDTKCWEKWLKS